MTELHLASKRDISLIHDSLETRHYYLTKFSSLESDPSKLHEISLELANMDRLLGSVKEILQNIQQEENA